MKSLLIAAHPGHELLLWKWLRSAHPDVVLLTNGAGSTGVPRLAQSLQVLADAGARWAREALAPVPDSAIYNALLTQQHAVFEAWCEALTRHVLANDIAQLVADEAEDYNPSHDLCRLLANEVVARAAWAGRVVQALGYPTVGHPSPIARLDTERHQMLQLSPAELDAKLTAMRSYASSFGGLLVQELEGFLKSFGADAYGRECLFDARPTRYELAQPPAAKPFFELHGEQRVAEGTYRYVIRASHLAAVATHLRSARGAT